MKFVLLIAVTIVAVHGSMDCSPNARFPWMTSTISLPKPFADYSVTNKKCCDAVNPNTPIDFNVECALCYGEHRSIPGFMLDPNNCQKFYKCVPGEDGDFIAHQMTCPDCMFWDDEKLSCVEVDPSCRVSVSVPTGTPNREFTHEPLLSCIDFENPNELSTDGMYVENNGVTIVENGVDGIPADFCPQGNKCGYFNGGELTIPFFVNNYESLPNIRITMDFRRTDTSVTSFMALVSTNCHTATSDNSLFFGLNLNSVLGYVKDTNHEDYYAWVNSYSKNVWQSSSVGFDYDQLTASVEANTQTTTLTAFSGLLNSHCPMVIGGPVKPNSNSKPFKGYIDNICIYIDYNV